MYLYCIVEANTPAHLALVERLVGGLIEKEPLFPVEADGLVAAVSFVPAAQFQEQPLNALIADLGRLTPFAVRHEAAIGALAAAAPAVIPMGFGTIYRDRERVTAVLRERAAEFRRILEEVRGKSEWGLRVMVDHDIILRHVETASVALRQLAEETARAGRGRAYLLGKRRQQVAAAETVALVDAALEAMFERLAEPSAAARRDELPANPPSGSLQLVLKAAFLVAVERQAVLEASAAELATAYRPRGFVLDLSGPWAPYSFVRTNAS